MNLQTAIQIASRGRAVIFLGAGFSFGAKNVDNAAFITSKKLAERISSTLGLPSDTPLTLAADIFRENKGTDELISLIKHNFTAATPVSGAYTSIAALPWRRIYTTNYDDLFEKACEASGSPVFSVTLSNRVRDIPKQSRCCVHLNGFVGKLDRASIEVEIKLTDSSYLQRAILDSEWAILLRQDLRIAKAVVFIGYSLYDYEIRKLLLDIPMLKDKTVFVLGPTPNMALVQQIQQYGTPFSKSTTEFADLISKRGEQAEETMPPAYIAVDEFRAPEESAKPTDADQWNLFLLGTLSVPCLHFSLTADDSYALRRAKTNDCLSLLEKGTQVLTVLSELGNGKSAFLHTLQFELVARGYRVFWIRESGEEAERELSDLAAQSGKKVFFLEGYPDRLALAQTFGMHAGDGSVLITTARTSVHDMFADELRELIPGKQSVDIRLDVLNDEELKWFSSIFTRFGMWGERAGASDLRKLKFLEKDCERQIHGILMKLLEAPQIQQRLTDLLSPLTENQKLQEVLICIMIVTMLGQTLTTDVLTDIIGSEVISGKEFRADPRIRQLVGFDSYTINVRSPIVAEYYLTRLVDKTATLTVLTELAERANKGRDASSFFRILFASLQRFSIVQRLFPFAGKTAIVTSYYEAIKSLDGCVKNFHFWLQYAIACLTLGERERSKRYFDQAYAIANERGVDTYQVDNHYSRYLLETAVEYPEAKDAMECFRDARDIINRQIKDERLHYPYRVALNYVRFVNRFGTKLKEAWVDEIEQATAAVVDRIPELPEERRANRHVRQCASELPYVIYKCSELKRKFASKESEAS